MEAYDWNLKTGKGVRKPEAKTIKSADPFSYAVKGKLWDATIDEQKHNLIVADKTGKEIATCKTPEEHSRGRVLSDDGRHFAISFQDRKRTVLMLTGLL